MRSHQDYCLRVCAVCWRKAPRNASPSGEALIKEFVISNYEIERPFFHQEYAQHAAERHTNIVRATSETMSNSLELGGCGEDVAYP